MTDTSTDQSMILNVVKLEESIHIDTTNDPEFVEVEQLEVESRNDAASDMYRSDEFYDEDVKPPIEQLFQPQVSRMVNTEKKKPEEREIVHRNTGKISKFNLWRRRRASMSADRAAIFFQNEASQQSPSPVQNRSQLVCRGAPVTTSIIVPAIPAAEFQSIKSMTARARSGG